MALPYVRLLGAAWIATQLIVADDAYKGLAESDKTAKDLAEIGQTMNKESQQKFGATITIATPKAKTLTPPQEKLKAIGDWFFAPGRELGKRWYDVRPDLS